MPTSPSNHHAQHHAAVRGHSIKEENERMSADEKQEPCLPPRIITNLLSNASFASTLLEYHTADPHDTSEAILSAPTLGGAFGCPTVRESVACITACRVLLPGQVHQNHRKDQKYFLKYLCVLPCCRFSQQIETCLNKARASTYCFARFRKICFINSANCFHLLLVY